jgi:hypothetical protein
MVSKLSRSAKGVSIMEPGKQEQELDQTPQARPGEKKRRFRLVKLEEQRFRMDRLEDRVAPLIGSIGLTIRATVVDCNPHVTLVHCPH